MPLVYQKMKYLGLDSFSKNIEKHTKSRDEKLAATKNSICAKRIRDKKRALKLVYYELID